MFVLIDAAIVLLVCLAAVVSVIGLFRLWRHPRSLVQFSVAGAALACLTITIQLAAPLLAQVPASQLPYIWSSYFLAMAHLMDPAAPFPFFWSPQWLYRVGTLTPLIAVGGVMAVVFGLAARRAGDRSVPISSLVGLSAIAAYVGVAVMAARAAWFGVPV